MQESSSLPSCSGLPVASSLAPSALSSTWMLSSSTLVSSIFLQCLIISPSPLSLWCIDHCCASPQISWASLQKTRGGSGPGGLASSCVVPYSSSRLSSCLVSPSHCRSRRERRGQRVSRWCCLPLWVQTMRLQSPAMVLYATMSLPTAPPAVSSSGVSVPHLERHCSVEMQEKYNLFLKCMTSIDLFSIFFYWSNWNNTKQFVMVEIGQKWIRLRPSLLSKLLVLCWKCYLSKSTIIKISFRHQVKLVIIHTVHTKKHSCILSIEYPQSNWFTFLLLYILYYIYYIFILCCKRIQSEEDKTGNKRFLSVRLTNSDINDHLSLFL